MMEFYDQVGPMALGSRLRRLSDRLYESARQIYELYEVPMDPKWFPVFYVLSDWPQASTQEIADYVGHSHASISQIVKAMTKEGFVSTERSASDGRKNVLKLTQKGRQVIDTIRPQYQDVGAAAKSLLGETQHDVWYGLSEIEHALDRQDFFSRVRGRFKKRREAEVTIVDFNRDHGNEFHDINIEWIEKYFNVEAADRKYLEQPEETILKPGGHILMALLADRVVGTCALIPMENGVFELAKMGVKPEAQGRRVGWQLGQACIRRAKAVGARKIYLESSRRLKPAISLYRQLGFVEVAERPSPYSRADIYMELSL